MARRSGLFPGGAAHGPGLGGALPARKHADFDRLELPRHDQGVSLSPAPDRLLDACHGNAAGGARGSAIDTSENWLSSLQMASSALVLSMVSETLTSEVDTMSTAVS